MTSKIKAPEKRKIKAPIKKSLGTPPAIEEIKNNLNKSDSGKKERITFDADLEWKNDVFSFARTQKLSVRKVFIEAMNEYIKNHS